MRILTTLLTLLVISVTGYAQTMITVGTGKQFTTIAAALQSIPKPMTTDVVLVVDIPSTGYSELGYTVDLSYLQTNGHDVSIIASNGRLFTYYVDEDVEFRFREGDKITRIENSSGAVSRNVCNGGNSSNSEYFVRNHIGSTVTMIDSTGTRVGPVFEYYPFGKQVMVNVAPSGTGMNSITQTFTGKEMDLFSGDYPTGSDGQGLDYFGARYYDPDIAMWTSVDPKRQFANGYVYAGNLSNPTNSFDPDGNSLKSSVNSVRLQIHRNTNFDIVMMIKMGYKPAVNDFKLLHALNNYHTLNESANAITGTYNRAVNFLPKLILMPFIAVGGVLYEAKTLFDPFDNQPFLDYLYDVPGDLIANLYGLTMGLFGTEVQFSSTFGINTMERANYTKFNTVFFIPGPDHSKCHEGGMTCTNLRKQNILVSPPGGPSGLPEPKAAPSSTTCPDK
jgi:RHS repeat-associated protein